MKRWQRIAIILLAPLVPASLTGTASASNGNVTAPILADIVTRIAVIIDAVLGYFVTGNNLTEAKGTDLVASLATIVHNAVTFAAQMLVLFVNTTLS